MRQYISRAIYVGTASLALVMSAGIANGALVLNGGFEALTGSDPSHFSGGQLASGHSSMTLDGSPGPSTYLTSDPAPYWTITRPGAGTMNPSASLMPAGPLEGQNVGYSTGPFLSQNLSLDIAPSTRYILTVGVGRTTLAAGGFAYYTSLSSGGFVLVDDHNSVPIDQGAWGTSTLTWDSPGDVPDGSTLTINLASNGGTVLFDNVQFSAVSLAPEPTIFGVLVAPALVSVMRRRRPCH